MTEDILGRYGFRVKWTYCNFYVTAVVYDNALHHKDGRANQNDYEDLYLSAYVRWDGCTDVHDQHHHWCSPSEYKLHFALLEYLYRRAFELMGREAPEDFTSAVAVEPEDHGVDPCAV